MSNVDAVIRGRLSLPERPSRSWQKYATKSNHQHHDVHHQLRTRSFRGSSINVSSQMARSTISRENSVRVSPWRITSTQYWNWTRMYASYRTPTRRTCVLVPMQQGKEFMIRVSESLTQCFNTSALIWLYHKKQRLTYDGSTQQWPNQTCPVTSLVDRAERILKIEGECRARNDVISGKRRNEMEQKRQACLSKCNMQLEKLRESFMREELELERRYLKFEDNLRNEPAWHEEDLQYVEKSGNQDILAWNQSCLLSYLSCKKKVSFLNQARTKRSLCSFQI